MKTELNNIKKAGMAYICSAFAVTSLLTECADKRTEVLTAFLELLDQQIAKYNVENQPIERLKDGFSYEDIRNRLLNLSDSEKGFDLVLKLLSKE